MSTLGVRAVDDYTVEFTLISADPLFPELLVTAAAMPCNRAFFESTIGRYGLGKEYIIFNGAYYLRRINNSSYVISPNPYSKIANPNYKNVYLFGNIVAPEDMVLDNDIPDTNKDYDFSLPVTAKLFLQKIL